MYTSYIGKKFLNLYNKEHKKMLSAREFFDDVLFPLFFDDENHLMHVGNSPFFQKPTQKAIDLAKSKSKAQLAKLHNDIANDSPNMAIYVGYAAKDLFGTTSGQLTNMKFNVDSEEMYSSWIGEALGIGVSGGFVILIDDDFILNTLYSGWERYRKFLNQTPNLKDKQIETWNGHWLCYIINQQMSGIDMSGNLYIEPAEVQGNLAIPTQSWSRLVFSLAKKFPNHEIVCYAYNLSQTNTTLGFIKLYLPEILRMYQLRDRYFIDQKQSVLKDKEIEELETFYNFKNACKMGTIGLSAIEPRGLRAYMPTNTYIYSQGKDYKFSDDNSFYYFFIYKLWVIAMLNKTELLKLASEVATIILEFETADKADSRGKTVQSHGSANLLESKSIKVFIDNLTETLVKQNQNSATFKKVVEEVLIMPVDHFPLFLTLIKFEYNFQKFSKGSK